MGSYDGPTTDDIDRTEYVNGDEVEVVEHADTVAGQVAYGATCETHGELMNGDWHDYATAKQAVQQHLGTLHVLTAVEGYNIIRFLARTFLAPDASDPDEVNEAEAKADAAFAALDRFDFKLVADFITAQGDHFEQWAEMWGQNESWGDCGKCGKTNVMRPDDPTAPTGTSSCTSCGF